MKRAVSWRTCDYQYQAHALNQLVTHPLMRLWQILKIT